jgi:TPR repeat protein
MAYDAKEAFYWFKRAAELGLPEAQNGVAFLYATGQGVAKNVVEAYAYYNLSGLEQEVTQTNLAKLKSEMTAEQINSGIKRFTELRKEIEAKKAAKKDGK